MKKTMGLSSLILAGVLAFSGCNNSEIDANKSNTLMENIQEYLDKQEKIDINDINLLIEDIQKYFDEQVSDMEELMNNIEEYLNAKIKLTDEEIFDVALNRLSTLYKMGEDHNYTIRVSLGDNGEIVTRVEYEEDNIKIYFYTINEEDEKSNEVYRVVEDGYVYTYIKDIGKYSKVPVEYYSGADKYIDLYTFSNEQIALEENKSWKDLNVGVDERYLPSHLMSYLENLLMVYNYRDVGNNEYPCFENMVSVKYTKEVVTGADIIESVHDTNLGLYTLNYKFTENGIMMDHHLVVEDELGRFSSDSNSGMIELDQESLIDFDTTLYTLVTEA